MESGVLWREEMQKLHDTEYQDVELSHMYADNCAMQLVLAIRGRSSTSPSPTISSVISCPTMWRC